MLPGRGFKDVVVDVFLEWVRRRCREDLICPHQIQPPIVYFMMKALKTPAM